MASCGIMNVNLGACIAIDIGTDGCGVAFSFNDKSHVFTDESQKKEVSHVLLNADLELVAFGEEADTKNTELFEEGKNNDYFYFDNIKMQLYGCNTPQMDIHDFYGRPVSAVHLMKVIIRHWYHEGRNKISEHTKFPISPEQIKVVLTVPAIWNEPAKEIMFTAARQAGISENLLTLALEPEAAAIASLDEFREQFPDQFVGGTTYMVVDCGGGTVDITVHEIQNNGALKELHAASGGNLGSHYVTKAFLDELRQVCDDEFDLLSSFKRTHPEDYRFLEQEFDNKVKEVACSNDTDNRSLRLSAFVKDFFRNDLDQLPDGMELVGSRSDQLRLTPACVYRLFDTVVSPILRLIQATLDEVKQEKGVVVQHLFVVGGFSLSTMLFERFEDQFRDAFLSINRPSKPIYSVMRGAVLYGIDPKAISSRVMRYTVGHVMAIPFNPLRHPASRKVTGLQNSMYVDRVMVFIPIVFGGENVDVCEAKISYAKPMYDNQTTVEFMFFEAPLFRASFVDEDLFDDDERIKPLGQIEIPITPGKQANEVRLKLSVYFGREQIKAIGRDLGTQECRELQFQCVDHGR